MPTSTRALIWFKNDLRVEDNEALFKATQENEQVLPVFCLDERLFKNLNLGFKKTGLNRFIFLKESIANLRENLKKIGGDLMIITGKPEELLPDLVNEYKINAIYTEAEYVSEELEVIQGLMDNLDPSVVVKTFWGKTLYHINDLPYSIPEIPLTSKAFRINTTKQAEVRPLIPTPEHINPVDDLPETEFPSLISMDFEENEEQKPYLPGGETAALARLEHYTFGSELLTGYRWSRNRSLGLEYSSKFSAYMALGCISARTIYFKVKQYEAEIKKNQSTWWLVFEMVWRDFFTFKGMRMGNIIFTTEGFSKKKKEFTNDTSLFRRWCDGMTGIPFIDSHMRQLNATGYMSNRGRVNCSSFLVHDYGIDWTWGAAYFENTLIDYDVTSNWMNWHMQAYQAYYTNPVHQSLKYKADEYIRKWIPELAEIETNHVHAPWLMDPLPKGYPRPAEVYSKWGRSINNILKTIDA